MLYDFYGKECPHCIDMHPLVEKLEREHGVTVVKKEVWHNDENRRELEAIDDGSLCGGVPFFYNDETKGFLCGSSSYEELKRWAGK